MNTEQDWNIEIKMSGKEIGGYMMTDKKVDKGRQRQIIY